MALDMEQRLYENQRNLCINLNIIKSMWEKEKGSLGEGGKSYSGKENDFDDIYGTLERSKTTLIKYMTCDYDYRENLIENWANKISNKTGITKEYLTGEKRILKENKQIKLAYEEFEDKIDEIGDLLNLTKKNKLYWTDERIKKYVSMLSKDEQVKFEKYIKPADKTILTQKKMKNIIDAEVQEILSLSLEQIRNKYDEDIHKLIYFIREKKKSDELGVKEVIDIINRTNSNQLKLLGKEGLENYIAILEKQLNLAKSVYTVCTDLKIF